MAENMKVKAGSEKKAPCNDCSALQGADRGRGRPPHSSLVRETDDHLTRHGYKCTNCGASHFHDSVAKIWL